MEFHLDRNLASNRTYIIATVECGSATSVNEISKNEEILDNTVLSAINTSLAMLDLPDIKKNEMYAISTCKACDSVIVIQREYQLPYKDIENDTFVALSKIFAAINEIGLK